MTAQVKIGQPIGCLSQGRVPVGAPELSAVPVFVIAWQRPQTTTEPTVLRSWTPTSQLWK